ncbi:MAG TPA: M23 family metallopeptidase [Bryobacteraceae bacterium]|nr:M23 family metallopeptidase [Bryobacteraceae bacterium]
MELKPYFVVVLAHSLHGRLRRIHIPHQAIYAILVLAVVGLFTVIGGVASYGRMVWKVSHYNSLRAEVDSLRTRYRELQKVTNQKNEQLATLELFANEVSVRYGLNDASGGNDDDSLDRPNYHETLAEYNFLKVATFSRGFNQYTRLWQLNSRPSLWPVMGRIMSPYGGRQDPFSGEGSTHTGVDISAQFGTPVKAAADGIVIHADWMSGYGRMVVIDHGNGLQTRYAHLSRFEVVPGQDVRRGDVIALSGSSGRATGPHLHFEVRLMGTPVNPYPYLAKSEVALPSPHKDFLF